jgi:hypothetical protein
MSRAGIGPQPSPAAGAPDPGADERPSVAGQRTGAEAVDLGSGAAGLAAPGTASDGTEPNAPDGAGPAGDAPEPRPPWPGWDPALRVAGLVIAIVAAIVSGVLELFLSTMRAGDLSGIWSGKAIGSGGGPLLGVSILLAAVVNYAIAWFAVRTTGRRWALGPPWALWTLMMLFAAGVRTDEGDYLLGGEDWVALVMILLGSLTFAVYSYRMILRPVRR